MQNQRAESNVFSRGKGEDGWNRTVREKNHIEEQEPAPLPNPEGRWGQSRAREVKVETPLSPQSHEVSQSLSEELSFWGTLVNQSKARVQEGGG